MRKQIRIIGFIQDDYDTVDEMKLPLPDDYLSKCDKTGDRIILGKKCPILRIVGQVKLMKTFISQDTIIQTHSLRKQIMKSSWRLYLGDLTDFRVQPLSKSEKRHG